MFLLGPVNTFPGGDYIARGGKGKQIRVSQPPPLQEAQGEPHEAGGVEFRTRHPTEPA